MGAQNGEGEPSQGCKVLRRVVFPGAVLVVVHDDVEHPVQLFSMLQCESTIASSRLAETYSESRKYRTDCGSAVLPWERRREVMRPSALTPGMSEGAAHGPASNSISMESSRFRPPRNRRPYHHRSATVAR
jgi:hypothetical protein